MAFLGFVGVLVTRFSTAPAPEGGWLPAGLIGYFVIRQSEPKTRQTLSLLEIDQMRHLAL